MRQHRLVRDVGESLGMIWSALKDVKGKSGSPSAVTRPVRQITATDHGEYVSSTTAIDPQSSSPLSSTATQSFTSSPPAKANVPVEDNSVHLVSCVIRHILWYSQDPDPEVVVESRTSRYATFNIGGSSVTAVDDGGLCVIARDGTRSQEATVLLEVKRRHEATGGKPQLPDKVLGQMTCEAIAARATQPRTETNRDHVFIIHAAQNYIRFFQFDISDPQVQQIQEGTTPTDAIKVHTTQ
ncbi:hypothetical protein ACHAQK_009882 [Fusarium lateritium]